jgi:hypothetical protein
VQAAAGAARQDDAFSGKWGVAGGDEVMFFSCFFRVCQRLLCALAGMGLVVFFLVGRVAGIVGLRCAIPTCLLCF